MTRRLDVLEHMTEAIGYLMSDPEPLSAAEILDAIDEASYTHEQLVPAYIKLMRELVAEIPARIDAARVAMIRDAGVTPEIAAAIAAGLSIPEAVEMVRGGQ